MAPIYISTVGIKCILCLLLKLIVCDAAKLNVPKLLLPYHSTVATNFTLEVSDGCFTWKSTRPEIVSVKPIGAKGVRCFTSAVVSPASHVPSRRAAIIIAQDIATHQQLRCDVIIDVIESIYLETTTHELYLDDSPEEFLIRATNQDGDVFSSLEGLVFDWNLLPDHDSGHRGKPATNVLRILSYLESSYEAPSYIHDLEQHGRRGDRILVRGIQTGSARVSVKPQGSAYKDIKETGVRIVVVANIQLTPPVVYMLPHTQVTYRAELLSQGHAEEITLPSPQYYLSVTNMTTATLAKWFSTITAREIGETDIILKDRNVDVIGLRREPTATIYVVFPSYLQFVVHPCRNWILEKGRRYEITVEIYDKESHKIFPSINLRVKAVFPSEYFKVMFSSRNGTFHIVETLQKGITHIEATLATIQKELWLVEKVDPELHTAQEVEIYDRVQVTPKRLLLPWDPPHSDNNYNYLVKAVGGSGNYTWTSSNLTVASVSSSGVVVAGSYVGHTIIKASDTRNRKHHDTMQAYVLPPKKMAFLSSPVEVEVGHVLQLPLVVYAVLDGVFVKFDDCQFMPFIVHIGDTNIFKHVGDDAPKAQDSCVSIRVHARTLGHVTVSVTYKFEDISLLASVTIASYNPLKPIDPLEVALVTPAATKEIVFEGGPAPWVLDSSRYFRNVKAENGSTVSLNPVRIYEPLKLLHSFRVKCTNVGEQKLTLQVGNNVTEKNLFPMTMSASIRFACRQPHKLRLIPNVKHPKGLPPCPITSDFDDPVPVQNHRPLLINFVLLDEEGRKFDNFSSLTVRWQLSDQRVASFVDKGEASRDVDNITFDDTKVVDLHGGGSEILTVEAVVKGYESSFFSSSIKTHLRKEVKASRRLQLVDEPQITPESLTVYNHISNKAQFVIRKGSGHFHVEHTGSKLANVNYDPKTRYIEMAPLEEGMFTIVVHDLCLATDTPTRTVIFISNVYQINLWVVDKVELHKSILAKVQVTDRNNKLIPVEYFPMMELSGQTGSSIITVKESDEKQDEGSQYTALYRVRGIALGRTTLQFVAVQKEHVQVYSQAREIQVFPPLRLQPRNITLIVGSLLQVTARGGPQPESTIEYTIQSDSIASVSSGGLINALGLGVTRVIGKAIGHGSDSGMVVYSEDEVTVNVVKLAGVRVFASLKRLQTGTKMPIYAVGVQENMTPFSFGSSIPPLHFHWTISNRHVADVKDLFYKSGLRPTPRSCFAMRLLAEEVGHVSVHLSVIPIPGSQLQVTGSSKLEDDIQIQVFEKLKLIGSEHYDSVMVITPNTEVQVRTNRDGSSAKMTYEVQGHIDGTHSDPVIAVTRHGQVISGSRTGQSSLLVTALEDFGVNQSVVILVKVKPVSYIMINADTVIHTTTGSIAWLPVGTTVQLSVTFHDDIGEMFFATNNKVMYRPNRFDLLQISHGNENNTLVAKATNIGQTVLKVWDGNTGRLVDYVNIVVGTIIEPRELLATLGDIVCFHCHITSLYGHTGSWSTNNAVAQIEPDSGIATAMQVGVVHIGYDVAGHHTVNEMTVLPVTRIQLNDEQIKFITNLPSKNRDCFIDVELRANDEESFPGNMHGANCSESLSRAHSKVWLSPFHCEVSLSRSLPNFIVEDLVQATPEFNPKTGTHQCRLTQVLSHDLQQVSTLDAVVQLRAVISDRPGQPEVASEFLSIPLVPAFHIATSELHLSNLLPKVRLRVSAVHAVRETLKVTSSDEALLEVLSPVINEQEQTIHFPVALNNLEILAEKTSILAELLVVCSKTRQKQTVAVSVKLIGQTADEYKSGLQSWWRHLLHQLAKNYPNIIFLLLCIVATAACIFIAYHAVLGQRYQAATPQAGAFLNPTFSPNHFAMPGSPWMSPLNTSGSPTRLWSVDYGPYSESGSPYRRSPLQRNSPQK